MWVSLFFAATMIVLGIVGLFRGNFTVIWQPVPEGVPARVGVLTCLCALVSLGAALALLFRRTATIAARALLGYFLLWRAAACAGNVDFAHRGIFGGRRRRLAVTTAAVRGVVGVVRG